jgi:hypothetical protein
VPALLADYYIENKKAKIKIITIILIIIITKSKNNKIRNKIKQDLTKQE